MNRMLLIAVLALALAAEGCGGRRPNDAPVVASAIGGPARMGDPSSGPLDQAQRVLVGATAQGLVRFDANGQIEPGLAERWIVTDQGRSYIFRLREATWPDGQPVTAGQVVHALRRAAEPASRNPLSPFLKVVDEIVEMTPQVIEVRLSRPRPDLLKLFAQPELAIVRYGMNGGSGPFRVQGGGREGLLLRRMQDPTEVDPDASPSARRSDDVQLRGERAALALARFKDGHSDLVLGGSFNDWPIAVQARIAPANIEIDPAVGLFGFNVTRRDGFLADPTNRAAIAMAIDRETLTHAIHPDWAPIETLLPARLDSAAAPAAPSWSALPIEARIAGARQRVDAWRRAHPEPVVVRVALPNSPGGTIVWGYVGAALVSIGLEPHRVAIDSPAELRLVDAVAPYDSGRWFIAMACRPCSGSALALIEAARDAFSLHDRAQRIADADAALAADSAYIPIAQPLRWSIVALRLQGWQGNTRAWHPLNHLRNKAE